MKVDVSRFPPLLRKIPGSHRAAACHDSPLDARFVGDSNEEQTRLAVANSIPSRPLRPTASHRLPYFVAAELAFLRNQHEHMARHAVPSIERGDEFPSPHLAFERSVKSGRGRFR